MRGRWSGIVRVGVTVVLIGLVLSRLDLEQFAQVLIGSNWWWLLPAVALQLGMTVLAAGRWRAILDNFRIWPGWKPLVQLGFIGSFFNLCLPSSIGGDVFRAYYLAKRAGRSMTTTLTTTILERNGGLCALLLIGASASLWWGLPRGGAVSSFLFPLIIVLYLLANLALFHSRLHRLAGWTLRRLGWTGLEAKMELVYEGLRELIRNRWALLRVVAISLLIQTGSVTIVWVASHALSLELPFPVFLVLVPIVNLSIMVPVTINGFGLREGLYVLLFTGLGVSREQAVALSLLNALVVMAAALPGGVVYSLYKKDPGFDAAVEADLKV